MPKVIRLLKFLNVFIDIFTLNIAMLAAYYILWGTKYSEFRSMLPYFLIINFCWLFVQSYFRIYDNYIQRNSVSIYNRLLKALTVFYLTVVAACVLSLRDEFSSEELRLHMLFYIYVLSIFTFAVLLDRFVLLIIRKRYRGKIAISKKKIVIVGDNNSINELYLLLNAQEDSHYNVLGVFHDVDNLADANPIYRGSTEDCIDFLRQHQVDEVFCTMSGLSRDGVKLLMREADKRLVRFRMVPTYLSFFYGGTVQISMYQNVPIIAGRREPLEDLPNAALKRLFDVCFSLIVISCILSWLLPILAILVKLSSKGPVFFKQERSGRDNKAFYCLKLRTMKVNGQSDEKQASKGDSRVTKIGAFLRKTSLDELPQFFNVLVGNMSVVGPRPHMLKHTQDYAILIDQFMVRHFVKPGITGWAQVSGYRGETKTTEDMEKRVEADVWYLENWSFLLDLKIIFLTVWNIIRGEKNAY